MIFTETKLKGSYVIEPKPIEDARGFFALTFSITDFAELGLETQFVQFNISYNKLAGTLRGMHFQVPPHAEVKLVRCTAGKIYDVIVDIRENSPTFCQWIGVELSSENRKLIYIPKGFAHGYQTLAPNSEVEYQVSTLYAPGFDRTLKYDDAAFKIQWPMKPTAISDKDKAALAFELVKR